MPLVFQKKENRGDDADVESLEDLNDAEQSDQEQYVPVDRNAIEPRQEIFLR